MGGTWQPQNLYNVPNNTQWSQTMNKKYFVSDSGKQPRAATYTLSKQDIEAIDRVIELLDEFSTSDFILMRLWQLRDSLKVIKNPGAISNISFPNRDYSSSFRIQKEKECDELLSTTKITSLKEPLHLLHRDGGSLYPTQNLLSIMPLIRFLGSRISDDDLVDEDFDDNEF